MKPGQQFPLRICFCSLCLLLSLSIASAEFTKVPNNESPDFPSTTDYLTFLERFPLYAESIWHFDPLVPEDGYWGTGRSDNNNMRILGSAIFTTAVLIASPDYDSTVSGVPREQLTERLNAALRYLVATHVTGSRTGVDGKPWGKQPAAWLSSWVLAKTLAGCSLVWDQLDPLTKAGLRRVVEYEAEYQQRQPAASRADGDTEAELNAWNGEFMGWAAVVFAEHPRAQIWYEKAQDLFMNTLSVYADTEDTRIVEGKAVKDWVYTTNVHPDFTIEGHGGWHFGYAAAPLHSLAWGYAAFVLNGRRPPETVFHHVSEVWDVLKRLHLYQGRFAYLEGKDWARYAYGLAFILPALVMIEQKYADADARTIEGLRFHTFEWEQRQNNDGSVFGQRILPVHTGIFSMVYETDCYANVGLAFLLHQYKEPIAPTPSDDYQRRIAGSFRSSYSNFVVARSPRAFISFSWQDLIGDRPMGLFVPGDDHIVEWQFRNLTGRFTVAESPNLTTFVDHRDVLFHRGFATVGNIEHRGSQGERFIEQRWAMVALADLGLAILIDQSRALRDLTLLEQVGLEYSLPNDLFNGNERTLKWPGGGITLQGVSDQPGDTLYVKEDWINVDEKLSFIRIEGDAPFFVEDVSRRNASYQSLLLEGIALPYENKPRQLQRGESIRRTVAVLFAGSADETEQLLQQPPYQWIDMGTDSLIGLAIPERDWYTRRILINLGDQPRSWNQGGKIYELSPLTPLVLLDEDPVQPPPTRSESQDEDIWGFEEDTLLAYPNPFHRDTELTMTFAEDADRVRLRIYSLAGRLVREFDIQAPSRWLSQEWDGRDRTGEPVGRGVYYCKATIYRAEESRRTLLFKLYKE